MIGAGSAGSRGSLGPRAWGFGILFTLGFLLRALTLGAIGQNDVDSYRRWGDTVLRRGLADGYPGVYFPFQHQLFAFAVQLGRVLHHDPRFSLKLENLLFDCGILGLLWTMLPTARNRLNVLLFYWLNPWFLSLAFLGYCDFQFAFFVVAFLFIVSRSDGKALPLLAAGVPLALSFLMKPQAMVLMAALGVFVVASLVRKRPSATPVLLLIPCILVFLAYSGYFALHGKPGSFLLNSYRNTSNVMPCITAQMLNLWYPITRSANPADFKLPDTVSLWRTVSFRTAAEFICAGFLSGYAVVSSRAPVESPTWSNGPLLLVAFSTLLLPMTMTGAHENHLFLGSLTVLLALCSQADAGKPAWAGYILLLFGQTINLVGLYRLGRSGLSEIWPIRMIDPIAEWPLRPRSNVIWLASAFSILGFILLFDWFWRVGLRRNDVQDFRARLPTMTLVLTFFVIYTVSFAKLDQLRALSRVNWVRVPHG